MIFPGTHHESGTIRSALVPVKLIQTLALIIDVDQRNPVIRVRIVLVHEPRTPHQRQQSENQISLSTVSGCCSQTAAILIIPFALDRPSDLALLALVVTAMTCCRWRYPPIESCLSCPVRFIPLHVLRLGLHTRARGLRCVSATVDPFSGYPHASFQIPFCVYFQFVLC